MLSNLGEDNHDSSCDISELYFEDIILLLAMDDGIPRRRMFMMVAKAADIAES